VFPAIDVLVILYNSRQFLPAFLDSLAVISIPVNLYFLDNNSSDGSADLVAERLPDLPLRVYLNRSLTNHGFARGMNLLAGMSSSEFMFVLNPDTELEPGALEILWSRAKSDSRIGICEARQVPREHPKSSDAESGETSWCSGAAALIRRTAFEAAGGFDDRLYFMYCEDVDLSWKLWILGWKCVYMRDACVRHFTQDLVPDKRRTRENYYTFRNSLFLFYRFGSWRQRRVLTDFLLNRFLSPAYSIKSKFVFGFALIDHIRYIPHLLQTRNSWSGGKHPWIRFEETSLSH
jgi:GT2 family glycosyltransferase